MPSLLQLPMCMVMCLLSRAFMVGASSQLGDPSSSWTPGLTSGFQGFMNVHLATQLSLPQ